MSDQQLKTVLERAIKNEEDAYTFYTELHDVIQDENRPRPYGSWPPRNCATRSFSSATSRAGWRLMAWPPTR